MKTQPDDILGIVGKMVPSSEVLDHLSKYLCSYSGTDKLFMVIQYLLKLIVPFVTWRARMQFKHKTRLSPTSPAADGLLKLSNLISDSRMLWRLFGLVPIVQWLSTMEKQPPLNRRLRNIERLEALSMLVFYPLEHLYYFGSHSVYAIAPTRLAALARWSCRAWAIYVVVHFLHIQEDLKSLKQDAAKSLALQKTEKKEGRITEVDMTGFAKKRRAISLDLASNMAYLPQTMHWSLEHGFFENEIWMSILGLMAGLTSFKSGWDGID